MDITLAKLAPAPGSWRGGVLADKASALRDNPQVARMFLGA